MNLPNKITLSRICLIPVFMLFFYLDVVPYHYVIATAIFVLAACTDFIDGHIARSRNLVTNLGKFLDPIADKVLVFTAFVLLLTNPSAFCVVGNWGLVFAGVLVSIIFARELIVSGFRMIASDRKVVIAADKLGKLKTITQDIALAFLIFACDFVGTTVGNVIAYVGLGFFVVCTVLTVVSGINYIVKNKEVLKG